MLWIKLKQKSVVTNQKGNRTGQALIEFVLGLMIVISFFFFFMKMSATFVVGNFIHYATFMSARAYMSSQDDQQGSAEDVLRKMVQGRWKALVKPDSAASGSVPGGYVGQGSLYSPSLDNWNQGTTFAYNANLSIYPWSKNGQGITLKLTSESWMPREQNKDECATTKGKTQGAVSSAGIQNPSVEWDINGC